MIDRVQNALWKLQGYEPYGRDVYREITRLKALPRYTPGTSGIFGYDFAYTDPGSIPHLYEDIFVQRDYDFQPVNSPPRIIDGGGNIGMSVTWFKRRFPDARIITFEPDPTLAQILRANIAAGDLTDVEVVEKAVWIQEESLTFLREGAEAGRVAGDQQQTAGDPDWQATQVSATRLRDWLDQPIDLLKLDIEGAEVDVLLDCADSLSGVANLIFEYHSYADRPQRLGELFSGLEEAGFRMRFRPEWMPADRMQDLEVNVGFDFQMVVFARRVVT